MEAKLIKELANFLGQEHVIEDPAVRRQASLGGDYLPDVVVYPGNNEEVARVVRLANEEGVAVIPWGAGLQAWRGLLPYRGGIALRLTRLQKIIEFDQDNQTAWVETGLSLASLNEAFQKGGLFLPLDPLEGEACTLGGCIAANASGPRKLAYGTTKDYLLGLEIVSPTGEIVHTGGKTVKNVQDYDNTRFLAGSWGSLGVVTKAILKLKPLPEKEVSLCLGFPRLEEACEAAFNLRQDLGPVALELMDAAIMEALQGSGHPLPVRGEACLLVAFAGFTEAVDWQVGEVRTKYGARAELAVAGEDDAAALWEARRQAWRVMAGGEGAILGSASLPFTATGKFIREARSLLDSGQQKVALVAHFGNGHVHVFLKHSPADYGAVREVLGRLQDLAAGAGGLFLVENINDLTMVRRWVEARGPALIPLLRRIKEALDPRRVLTPNSKVLAYVLDAAEATETAG
ncbi:FAD-binding oxidoreductase [Thermanaeromonas sp. C210]|uniref:FAD-binding oxidoreductase n=1 Tax=Thermanaeromonas sp. C210 TaxID=2731925 RepID=UPI00155BACD8|nr:FAD-binding oxidoreductase [Thermanaeromonas sp. C210]GFN21717.1 FAD linked oxidase-like protein [Thermanaeromonas sp. C210]